MNKLETLAKNILLTFVLVTLGFIFGKEVTLRNLRSQAAPLAKEQIKALNPVKNKIIVYYLHASFRCETCNTIEKMTADLLKAQFKEELASGLIEWKQADFQKEDDLAKKFQVISSCVVVEQFKEGKESGYKRLDEVWTLLEDKAAFNKYVGNAVQGYLDFYAGGDNS